MKEINNLINNLYSIYPVSNLYSDKQFLLSVIANLHALASEQIFLYANRPTYEIDPKGINDLISMNSDRFDNLTIENDAFEISFSSNKEKCTEELFEVLIDLWFAYEQPSIHFFKTNQDKFPIKRDAWYEITERSSSYIMFKGPEENVVWIGKSETLKLDTSSFSE